MLEKLTGGKIIIGLAVLFVLGVFLGFAIWGMGRSETVDYSSVLKDAAKYVATLESERIELDARAASQANEIKRLRSKNVATEQERQIDALEKRVNTLLKDNAALTATKEENKRLAQANQELKGNLQTMISDNQDLDAKAKSAARLQTEI